MNHVPRRCDPWLLASLVVLGLQLPACGPAPSPEPSAPPPNVLLITLDTTRADRMSCCGHTEQTTPGIDALLPEGVQFTRAVTQAAVTPVSHASILTGLYPYSHGLRVMHGMTENRLQDSHTTLTEVLADNGYDCSAFVSAFPVTERFGLHQGFDRFDTDFYVEPLDRIVAPDGVISTKLNQRRADVTTDRALAYLANVREPFFAWLHYFDPHDLGVMPPAEFMNQFPPPQAPKPVQLSVAYDIEIRYMDQQIRRVFEQLKQTGLYDNTYIVVVSDHGEGLGDHDWWSHGLLYQEQIHTPLIIRGPNVPQDVKVDYLVRTIDIMPTLLDLIDVPQDRRPAMEGVSLAPLWESGAQDPGLTAYADSINMMNYVSPVGRSHKKTDMLFCVIDGRWKYIHHMLRPEESELYDLSDDPAERSNLYEQEPEEAARLLADLKSRECFPEEIPGLERMSEDDLERLRSLGYIR